MKRLLCHLFGCHWHLGWITREEIQPGFVVEKRWKLYCRWCGNWSLLPPNTCKRCGKHEVFPSAGELLEMARQRRVGRVER